MEVQFGANQTPVSPTPTPETAPAQSTAIVPAPAPGLPQQSAGFVLGDKLPGFQDIIMPRLNIAQNIGELKDTFAPGSIVLQQTVPLYTPAEIDPKTKTVIKPATAPITICVLGFRPTTFTEKIAGAVRGLTVKTEDEVRSSGGTLDYAEWNLKKAAGMKLFQPFADALVAIQRPDCVVDDDAIFTYPVDGAKWTLALWGMKGTAYTAAAKKVFFTARMIGALKQGGYPSWNYTMMTKEADFPGGNKAWVPVCIINKKSSPEFIEFVKSVLSAA